jgi:peptidyl-prolyl cis-trans isomerase C
MKKLIVAVSVFILALALYGCGKGSDGAVLAKVNRSAITAADFKKQLEDLNPQMQHAVAMDPKARKEYLDDLIGIELVIQEAKRQGLDKESEFKKNVEARKKEVEEYKKKLDQRLQDEIRNELFNSVLKKDLAEKLKSVPATTGKEALDYYNKNKNKILTPDGRQIGFKEVEPQIKARLAQEKQRPLYLDYTKGLKAKASISVDDKALDSAVAELSRPVEVPEGLKVQKVPAAKEKGNK